MQLSSELFHLHFRSSLCLKILTTIFISKSMYIKHLFSSNKKRRTVYLPSDFVAHQFPIFALVIDPLIVRPSSKLPKSIQSTFPFVVIDRQSQLSLVPVRHHLGDVQGIIKHFYNTQNNFISHSPTY